MQLRSGKIIPSGSVSDIQENITMTFSHEHRMFSNAIPFREWLIASLKTYSKSVNVCYGKTEENTTIERCRLLCEMMHIISEHVDYISFSYGLKSVMLILPSRLHFIKNQITASLNNEYKEYTENERAFLGNVRADAVKLCVLLKNRK
uniref:Uncharacterized protein n=1 Tax=viral metagenome TaxID=1070528 RepID=A0A6C0HIR1_9ZZZZ